MNADKNESKRAGEASADAHSMFCSHARENAGKHCFSVRKISPRFHKHGLHICVHPRSSAVPLLVVAAKNSPTARL
jgi:hypothetical protein